MKTDWNPSSLRRLLLPLPLLALAVLARADYVVTYSGGGSSSTGRNGTVPSSGWGNATGGVGGSPSAFPGPGSAEAHGPVVATFTWQGDPSQIPDHVYVVERASASWHGDSGSCDDGLGDKKVPEEFGASCSGTRVRYLDSPGATFQVSLSPSANVSFGANGAAAQDGMLAGGCGFTYSAAATPYALSIHSDRDESFHKGANGQPESNTTDVLTPRFGDTWVDPASAATTGDGAVYYSTSVTFIDELIGGWINPLHEWTVPDGNGGSTTYRDLYNVEYDQVPGSFSFYDFQYADLSRNGPSSQTVNLTVTQDGGNGASLNAKYTLRLHHPHEKWQINPSPSFQVTIAPLQAGDLSVTGDKKYSTLGANCHCKWSKPSPFWDYATWANKVGSTQLRDPLWKAFFKIAEIFLPDLGGDPKDADAAFDVVWNDHVRVGATISGGGWNDDMVGFGMVPRYMYEFTPKYYQCDNYGPNGYTGKGERIAAKISAEYMSGDFYPVSRWNGGEINP